MVRYQYFIDVDGNTGILNRCKVIEPDASNRKYRILEQPGITGLGCWAHPGDASSMPWCVAPEALEHYTRKPKGGGTTSSCLPGPCVFYRVLAENPHRLHSYRIATSPLINSPTFAAQQVQSVSMTSQSLKLDDCSHHAGQSLELDHRFPRSSPQSSSPTIAGGCSTAPPCRTRSGRIDRMSAPSAAHPLDCGRRR